VTASFLAVRPNYSFHVASIDKDERVREMRDVMRFDIWVNGGYFILRRELLDQLHPGRTSSRSPCDDCFRRGRCSRCDITDSGPRWTR
jgi:NDP-sugar pyrophosphorylase family protein